RCHQRTDVWESCGVLRIGRRNDCQVILDDLSVSGNHALIRHQGEHWLLEDLGSTNGTSRNGVCPGTSEQVVLSQGDLLQFGNVVLIVESIDFMPEKEAIWFGGPGNPAQMLALLREHPLSHILPSIEGAIKHLTKEKIEAPYLWSPSNTRPISFRGGVSLLGV